MSHFNCTKFRFKIRGMLSIFEQFCILLTENMGDAFNFFTFLVPLQFGFCKFWVDIILVKSFGEDFVRNYWGSDVGEESLGMKIWGDCEE